MWCASLRSSYSFLRDRRNRIHRAERRTSASDNERPHPEVTRGRNRNGRNAHSSSCLPNDRCAHGEVPDLLVAASIARPASRITLTFVNSMGATSRNNRARRTTGTHVARQGPAPCRDDGEPASETGCVLVVVPGHARSTDARTISGHGSVPHFSALLSLPLLVHLWNVPRPEGSRRRSPATDGARAAMDAARRGQREP